MRNKVSKKLIFALLAISGASVAATQELYVAGPVENLAADGSQLTVLGQTISVSSTTRFFLEGRKISASRFAQNVGVGSFVYADLSQQTSSLRATNLLVTTTPYVAGASAVFVAGRVESYSPSVGRIRIGALDVDVTSISPDLAAQLSVGDEVQIAGVQPSIDRPFILVSDLKIMIDAELGTLGISGSGTLGISGSGSTIQGISGSGLKASAAPELKVLAVVVRRSKVSAAPEPWASAVVVRRSKASAVVGRRSKASAVVGRRSKASAVVGRRSKASAVVGRRSKASAVVGRRSKGSAVVGRRSKVSVVVGRRSKVSVARGLKASAARELWASAVVVQRSKVLVDPELKVLAAAVQRSKALVARGLKVSAAPEPRASAAVVQRSKALVDPELKVLAAAVQRSKALAARGLKASAAPEPRASAVVVQRSQASAVQGLFELLCRYESLVGACRSDTRSFLKPNIFASTSDLRCS